MNNITLLLLTHNNEEQIKSNLSWLKDCPLINEVINIDDESTDNSTSELAKFDSDKLTIKTFSRKLNNDFSSQRNFAISKSSNSLILWLDPDETPSKELIEFINHIDHHKYVNYGFKRLDTFLGHRLHHGENYHQYFIRLFHKESGTFAGKVHEIYESSLPSEYLNLNINHSSHSTLEQFFNKINLYSEIRSQELYDLKVKVNIFQIIFFPPLKFLKNYYWYLGFKDGTPGIIMAIGMSFYTFLVRSKLWCLYHP